MARRHCQHARRMRYPSILTLEEIISQCVECSRVIIEDRQCTMCLSSETSRFHTRLVQTNDGGIGRFLRRDILARAFAEFLARLSYVQNVVDDLKSEPKRAPEFRYRPHLLLGSVRAHSTESDSGR